MLEIIYVQTMIIIDKDFKEKKSWLQGNGDSTNNYHYNQTFTNESNFTIK